VSRPLESIAAHEAGHIVLMLALGFPVSSVTIVPVTRAGGVVTLGQVAPGIPAPPAGPVQPLTDAEAAMVLLAAAVIDVAGGVADELANFTPMGCGSDEESVDSIGDVVWERLGVQVGQWRHLVRAAAERYLRENWSAVQRVAAALLSERTLSGARVSALVGALPSPDLRNVAGALEHWHRRETRRAAQRTA
jgi:hypothetical protein